MINNRSNRINKTIKIPELLSTLLNEGFSRDDNKNGSKKTCKYQIE